MGTFSAGRSLPMKKCSLVYTSPRDLTFLKSNSLRSKRFQSSYCAKVERKATKKWMGEGSYTNFDNFVGELGGKACSAG